MIHPVTSLASGQCSLGWEWRGVLRGWVCCPSGPPDVFMEGVQGPCLGCMNATLSTGDPPCRDCDPPEWLRLVIVSLRPALNECASLPLSRRNSCASHAFGSVAV